MSPHPPARSVRVRVPASTANLGPGFDSLGLALTLHDEVEVATAAGGVTVEVSGEGADRVPRNRNHLVVKAMVAAFARMGVATPGLRLRCTNRIPHSRGLGSSSAAIVAGVLAARALTSGGNQKLPEEHVLRLASELEGHPDNVAACLLGGLTIAWRDISGARAVSLEPATSVVPIAVIPRIEVSTKAARALLPATVSHEVAAANSARVALLVAALTERPDRLLDATEDRLHQDFREAAMPHTLALLRRLRGAGLAAAVSGAGPTVVVLTTATDADSTEKILASQVNDEWLVRRFEIDRQGASVESLG